MEAQNYKNHRRYVPGYHIVLALILLLTFIGSIVNLVKCWGNHQTLYSASLIVVLTLLRQDVLRLRPAICSSGTRSRRSAPKKICGISS